MVGGTNYATSNTAQTVTLVKGQDQVPATANTVTAYSLFQNPDEVDISLVLTGDANIAVQQYIIDNIAGSRKDCIAFVSPPSANVINQVNSEVTNILSWRNALNRSSSYAVADCGWKYSFDKYNNVYRYVPLNGDIAGLCVNTDNVRDPWFSPAGFNRGNLKNVVKLAWNPTKTQRDSLYAVGINPVGTFPGNGTVLYGDKTLQTKPSAFDRINVRRLFIILEKTIAQAAQYSLFEFNDEFTRANFVSLVTPFLRDIQGRRGIYDFRVVCDITNNTPQVIDSNQFVGDIYIKPARSINFIQLNFVAVRTGVDFTEVVGKF
jgi:phage tail sheath protein FI